MKTLVSSPASLFFFCDNPNKLGTQPSNLRTTLNLHHPKLILVSSSSSSAVEEEQLVDAVTYNNSSFNDPSFSGCKACGKEQIEMGCNGEGRIQGGIATIPGFGWWPIKAYRPCPGYLASGGNYRRRGQSMDEVAFGGGKRGTSMDDFDETGTRKKGKNKRQFKG